MKDLNKRLEFVELRAQGLSLRKTAEEVGISGKTCERWNRELTDQINARKSELSSEIVEVYEVTREARIKRLSDTLEKLYTNLGNADFSNMPPDKLLKYTLAYEQQLKAEQSEWLPEYDLGTLRQKDILLVCAQIFAAQADGEISATVATGLLKSLSKLAEAVNRWKDENPLTGFFDDGIEL